MLDLIDVWFILEEERSDPCMLCNMTSPLLIREGEVFICNREALIMQPLNLLLPDVRFKLLKKSRICYIMILIIIIS